MVIIIITFSCTYPEVSISQNSNCLTKLRVQGKTGNVPNAGSVGRHRIELLLRDGTKLQGNLCPPFKRNKRFRCTLNFKRDLKPRSKSKCVELDDITRVSLIAASNDGWYIKSISTFVRTAHLGFGQLTKNDRFNKWLNSNNRHDRKRVLNLIPNCLTKLQIRGKTGGRSQAGSSSPHRIQLILRDGTKLGGLICSRRKIFRPNKRFICTRSFRQQLRAGSRCVRKSDIRTVRIIADGSDGWFIKSISTYVRSRRLGYTQLTKNDRFLKWLDNTRGNKSHKLRIVSNIREEEVEEPFSLHESAILDATGDEEYEDTSDEKYEDASEEDDDQLTIDQD